MRAGSDGSSAQPRGKKELVPVWSQAGSRDGSGCPPPAPWEEQGWVHGVLLWFPGLGSSFGTVLSHQCQVSSWLGVSSLSPGWPVPASPAHPGSATQTALGPQGMGASPASARGRRWGYPWYPSPASSRSRTGSLRSLRVPISRVHLTASGAGRCQQPAASCPLNGSFLACLQQQRGFVGARVPGAEHWHPPRWSPASPPPVGERGVGWLGSEECQETSGEEGERAWTCGVGSGELCPGPRSPPGLG